MRSRRTVVVTKRQRVTKDKVRIGFPPLLQAAAAVVVVMIALGIFFLSNTGFVKVQDNAYYYDIASGMVFVAERQSPPIEMGDGGTAVLAHVFTCGRCTEDEWFVGILETYEDGIRDIPHQRVASPSQPGQEPKWIPSMSPASASVNKALNARCTGGAKAKRCDPYGSIGFSILKPKSPDPGEKIVMKGDEPAVTGESAQTAQLATPDEPIIHDALPPMLPKHGVEHHWSRLGEVFPSECGLVRLAL